MPALGQLRVPNSDAIRHDIQRSRLKFLEHWALHVMRWPSFRKWQVQPMVDTFKAPHFSWNVSQAVQRLCGLVAQWSTLLMCSSLHSVQFTVYLELAIVVRPRSNMASSCPACENHFLASTLDPLLPDLCRVVDVISPRCWIRKAYPNRYLVGQNVSTIRKSKKKRTRAVQ
jgi:hypothetical protein